MKWLVRIIAGFSLLVLLVIAGVFAAGKGKFLMLTIGLLLGAPSIDFDPDNAVAAPDYANDVYWAALPGSSNLSNLVPQGVEKTRSSIDSPVDVFFIHPTGLMNGDSWISGLQATSKTEENTQWMMANQASAYNGCCQVYAPRYREANLFSYTSASEAERMKIMRFAYNDVLAAFENFIEHRNQHRPFILASHSQGTHHGIVLLRERIDGTPIAEQMIAAYLIGGQLGISEFEGLEDIAICDSATQLHCVVHWDTVSEKATPNPDRAMNVCVNPLSWRHNTEAAPKSGHVGAVLPSGVFQLDFFSDKFTGVKFAPLTAPFPNHLGARCADGELYVTDQKGTAFEEHLPGGPTYHLLDYALFYMDIRANAILRAQEYLKEN
jgi:hypothetical protein